MTTKKPVGSPREVIELAKRIPDQWTINRCDVVKQNERVDKIRAASPEIVEAQNGVSIANRIPTLAVFPLSVS